VSPTTLFKGAEGNTRFFMSRLFENYVEGILLKNQELHDLARRNHDEYHQRSTVVTRVMREILHEQVVWMEPDRAVMALVYEHLSKSMEEIAQLPGQVICPVLPNTPLLIDFGETVTGFEEVQNVLPPIAGMMFQCPGDRAIMRDAQSRLPSKYHALIQEVVGHAQTTWTLSCLDELGEEVLVYLYSNEYSKDASSSWTWLMSPSHRCPVQKCRYRSGLLAHSCDLCESIKAMLTMQLGLLLLYDSGYFQEIVVQEEREQRTYTVNPTGKTLHESETTREVRVRRIRKDVLRKELGVSKPVANTRGSWLEKHTSDEIETTWKKREPFDRSTPSGKVIKVTPTEAKRIRKLKRNAPERIVIELVASPKDGQTDAPKLQE